MTDENNKKDKYIEALEAQVRELNDELSKLKAYEEETFQGWHIIDFYWYAREHYSPDLTKEQCMIVGNYVNLSLIHI